MGTPYRMRSRCPIPVAGLLAAAFASAGCGGGAAERGHAAKQTTSTVDRTTAQRPQEILVERYPEGDYDFRGGASAAALEAAAGEFGRDAGGARVRVVGIRGVAGFRVAHRAAEDRLEEWRSRYLLRGVYVVRYDNSFGYGDSRDAILLLPTRDQFEVVRAVGTSGLNYDIGNARVVRWLRDVHRTHPFVVTEAGLDYVAGNFARPVRDPGRLARRFFRFCPDIVLQGTDTVAALAEELRASQTLYCWWD
jgi:hypothetical protein